MDFSLFRPFNTAFNDKYVSIREKYPFAFLMMEKQLRNFESGSAKLTLQNIRKASRLNIGRMIRSTIFAHTYKSSFTPQYYMSFERFRWLEHQLDYRMRAKNMSRFEPGKHLERLATRGLAYPKFMRIAAKNGLEAALEHKDLLASLNSDGKRNFCLIKSLLIKSKTKLVLTDGDTVPYAQMLCRAARQLGIPYVVFAHGYIQNPRLVGIAPINGDYLIPWTKGQFDDLAAELEEADILKLRYFGYPKEVFSSEVNSGQALIVWHTLLDRDREADIKDLVSSCRRVRDEGYEIRLRLHPKDNNDQELRKLLAEENINISKRSLGDDIREAEIIVGSYSSVLVEAAMSGKCAMQFSKYSKLFSFEGIHVLHPLETIREVALKQKKASSLQPFDFDTFEVFLNGVMPSSSI